MPPFTPVRASPQLTPDARRKHAIPNLSSFDVTVSSATSATSAALSNLTPEDVELIDEIIERSPPSATTFLTVFKAYNEVLAERKMDAANDVRYYNILLKLGVVKGLDWGAKWNTVKAQMGYDESRSTADEEDYQPPGGTTNNSTRAYLRPSRSPERRQSLQSLMRRRTAAFRQAHEVAPLQSFADSVSTQSYTESYSEKDTAETAGTETDADTQSQETSDATEEPLDIAPTFSSPRTLVPGSKAYSLKSNALELSTDASSFPPLPSVEQFLPVQAKKLLQHTWDDSQPSQESGERPRRRMDRFNQPAQKNLRTRYEEPRRNETSSPIRIPPRSRQPVIDDGDTSREDDNNWKKIRMARDEKQADTFRKVQLIRQCWSIWKAEVKQLAFMSARARFKEWQWHVRHFLGIWRSRFSDRQERDTQTKRTYDQKTLKFAFLVWKKRFREKQVIQWRDAMKKRLLFMKSKKDHRILASSWARWRSRHQVETVEEMAQMQYDRQLCSKALTKWTKQVDKYDRLSKNADEFNEAKLQSKAVGMWDFWRSRTELQHFGKLVQQRVHTRIKASTLEVWHQKLLEKRNADLFHDHYVVKHYWGAWKKSVGKIHQLEEKAIKYQNRQNGFLLRALLHVWATRERGALMDRTISSRTLQNAWLTWKARLTNQSLNEKRAVAFAKRPSSALICAAFNRWSQVARARTNLLLQAARYDEDLLMHRTLLVWRVLLRVKLKKLKHAKVARKYLLLRQAWNNWKIKIEEKRRLQKLQTLDNHRLKKVFDKWHADASRRLTHRRALQQFDKRLKLGLAEFVLNVWTNRVIAIRLRELDVIEQRDAKYLSHCFAKWKEVFRRHSDDFRLMQSYQLVKREELLRRTFSRWFSAAKTSRHRRLLLTEREEDMKLALAERAWDKWRERFSAERLRPLEHAFYIQTQKTRLYQAFLIWHAKTMSIPAIQFFSIRTKARFWQEWRKAMPKALQTRKARVHDERKLLSHTLDKWVQVYRTKIALKAVARARYLRLPSGAPRQSLPLSSALSGIWHTSNSVASTRTTRPLTPSTGTNIRTETQDNADNESIAASSATRRYPRLPTKRLTTRTVMSEEDAQSPGRKTDIWHELRRARKPLSLQRD